jgi:hypothetical protein
LHILGDFKMSLDDAWNTFGENNDSGWTLPVDTLQTDLPEGPIINSVPQNVVSVDRDSGISVTGILNGVTATADTLGGIFGKVYNLTNQFANQKFQQEVTKSTLEVNKAKTLGTLELTKAQIDAQREIGLMQAKNGVANAQAQMNSPGALRVGSQTFPIPSWLPLVGAGFLAYKLFKGKKA